MREPTCPDCGTALVAQNMPTSMEWGGNGPGDWRPRGLTTFWYHPTADDCSRSRTFLDTEAAS